MNNLQISFLLLLEMTIKVSGLSRLGFCIGKEIISQPFDFSRFSQLLPYRLEQPGDFESKRPYLSY